MTVLQKVIEEPSDCLLVSVGRSFASGGSSASQVVRLQENGMEVSPKSQGVPKRHTVCKYRVRCRTDLGAPTALLSQRADFSVP